MAEAPAYDWCNEMQIEGKSQPRANVWTSLILGSYFNNNYEGKSFSPI